MNKDQRLLEEAYLAINEAKKKKLSPAQKKIAAAAPPPDEITGADFKALKAKKKKKLEEAYDDVTHIPAERTAALEKATNYLHALRGAGYSETGASSSNLKQFKKGGKTVELDIDLTGAVTNVKINGEPFHGNIHQFSDEVNR